MTSTRESALLALYSLLQELGPTYQLYRNHDKAIYSPNPVVILRDGESNEPDVILSPIRYIYEHYAKLEIIIEHPDHTIRDARLDDAITAIGAVLLSNPTLSGAVEWMEAHIADLIDQPLEGAVTVKAASIPIMLRFTTSNPLL